MEKGKLEFRYVMIKVAVSRKKIGVHNTISKNYTWVCMYIRGTQNYV